MATKLNVYNGALRILGARSLASLTDNRDERRELDALWAGNEAIDRCLAAGQWNWATRAVRIPYDTNVTPAFGYTHAFEKPEDFVRTTHFCWDEMFRSPLTDYMDAGTHWYAEPEEVFVRYVSKANDLGANLGVWPIKFTDYVEAYCASQIALRVTESLKKQEMAEALARKALIEARSWDAMEGPTQELPAGSWVNSRGSQQGNRRRHGGFLG